jgi:hypothetical protein
MPEAVQIKTQSEQQSLTLLRAQRAARRASREHAFHRIEQALDQSVVPVEPSRKCPPHFGAHSMDALAFLSALAGNHALRRELFPDVGAVSLAVEFSFGLL